jgi:hypothetical protein
MKVAILARGILASFVCVFILAAAYLLFDVLGIWARLPEWLARATGIVTGLILLFALVGHLVLATGGLPREDSHGQART